MPPMSQAVPIPIHVQDTEEHLYEYVTTRTSFSPAQDMLAHYSSADSHSSIIQKSREQMLVSQEKTLNQAKPPVARKPTKLKQNPTSSSSLYTEMGSLDTSTGDSGFVDPKPFRKDCPPRVHPRHKYTPLNAEQRETVSGYAIPELKGKQTAVLLMSNIYSLIVYVC